jgi:transcription termination factor NusB
MTPEARFEEIERTLQIVVNSMAVNQEIQKRLLESQERMQQAVSGLAESVEGYVDGANARMNHLDEAIDRYVKSAETRMKLMEANLDNLIRIITAEHTNGKSKP